MAAMSPAQLDVLSALFNSPALPKEQGKPYPEGMDGRVVAPMVRDGLVFWTDDGKLDISLKGRVAYTKTQDKARWVARKTALRHTMDTCPSGGCNTCDANPYDCSP